MSLLFTMLSRFVIAFLPRSKHLLISWLQSPSAVILEPKKIKSVTVSIVSPSICYEVMGLDCMIFVFGKLSFKPAFSLSSFIKRLFHSSLLSAVRMVSSAYLRLLILSAALSQHYLLGFEKAQLEFHHLHWLCSYWCTWGLLDFALQDIWLCMRDHTIVVIWVMKIFFCIVLLCILATSS